MLKLKFYSIVAIATICTALAATAVTATTFDVPSGSLESALDAYSQQSGVQLVIPNDQLKGVRSAGVRGDLAVSQALTKILLGTGFIAQKDPSGLVGIVRDRRSESSVTSIQLAAATATPASLETVTVTSSKIGGDVQNIPIAITALSQEQLTATQTAGGPDLIKQVPNMTFTKTNFAGYSIQIRGIGTQAISVTTDPAVAVAFNDIPFIRNHFFEQEFYDVASVEVARGPQGTLYGRNATAGVVNLVSAKPGDQFEAMASADVGNYQNRRLEAMLNIPIVDDKLDVRVAGEWTKRNGYSTNELTDQSIDGRDLWSSRVTIGWKPVQDLQTYLVWEHFQESDDRLRSAKQLCKTDFGPGEVGGNPKPVGGGGLGIEPGDFFTQGCVPTSLYSPDAFQAPLSFALPYVVALEILSENLGNVPYDNVAQSPNLRVIETEIEPTYRANNDTLEFNADYNLTPALTLTSQTGYNRDFLWSTEDFNRFGSNPGFYKATVCDPQLGCSNRLIAEDLSEEHAWQLSQEFRVASNFSGPLNFSAGTNYMHYETMEFYYVFINALTIITGGCPSNSICGYGGNVNRITGVFDNSGTLRRGFQYNNPNDPPAISGGYIDPNPITHLDNNGHNYFLSQNPYVLNSYAAFGEANYTVLSDLKLTAGVRWTDDRKHFSDIPSWVAEWGWGYPIARVVDQQWDQFTGRAVANWTPKLDFTDQTLVYGSYAHGYKAGGANPPGAIFSSQEFVGTTNVNVQPIHPLTFKPEFVDAFELGTKNTLLDGALTLNGDFFYYNYENYQVSEIVDRTAINRNFDAHAKGAELEATWEPLPGLRFNFAGGWEDTALAKGDQAVDLMDRTAGHSDWFVVKPFVNEASNCIFPGYVAKWIDLGAPALGANVTSYCASAYDLHLDPLTGLPYVANPTVASNQLAGRIPPGYIGFDPTTAPNDGAGFSKNLGGNSLPNAPPYTVSAGAQYTMPLSTNWAGTLRGDFYWQDASWWRVFNDLSYDRLRGYDTVNLTLIFTNQNGWQVMLYDKNVFNVTAITGAFLNSDDTGLTTNVFLTDPKLIGIRVTKNW